MNDIKKHQHVSLDLSDIAAALRTARNERMPIDAPTKKWASLDAEGAFQVQKINSDFAVQNGDHLVGYKLGNISRVMQVAFGLDHPDYGFLHAKTIYYERLAYPPRPVHQATCGDEPAFVLKSALNGPNVTVAHVISI